MNNYVIKKLTQSDIPEYLSIGMQSAPCVLYGIHDKNFAWICQEEMCDFEYIEKHKIPYKKLNAPGSTIICSKGDMNLGFFGTEEFCEQMFNKISNLISKKLTDKKFLNNDFMYDGNKYGSITRMNLGDVYYIGVHLSNSIDTTLINKICLKTCYKIPAKLPVTVTEQDILDLYKE